MARHTTTTSTATASAARRNNAVLGVLTLLTMGCLALTYTLGLQLSLHEDDAQALREGLWALRSLASAASSINDRGVRSSSVSSSDSSTTSSSSTTSLSALSRKDIPAEDRVIIHFSTDCTSFQHWQAMTMLESAERVGQRGAIVRVVCGCEQSTSLTGDDQLTREQIEAEHAAFAEHPTVASRFRFHLLFVEDMTGIGNNTARYKFANKAQSLHFWLDTLGGGTLRDVVRPDVAVDEEDEDVAIVSIDPDFLFLTPFGPRELGLLSGAGDNQEEIQDSSSSSSRGGEVIARMRGRPIAQAYGLDSSWMRFPVCQDDMEGCALVTQTEATQHYNVGPPYVLHRADWFPFIDAWTSIIPATHAQYPLVSGPDQDPTRHYAEMFAWAIAAAKLHLPHTLLQREMVGCMVGWPSEVMGAALNDSGTAGGVWKKEEFRCGLDSVIRHPGSSSSSSSSSSRSLQKFPAFLHYCQKHRIRGEGREWWWYKRMLPADLIFDCGPHLVELPPPESFGDGRNENGFIVCTLTEIVNACKRRFRRSSACRARVEVEEEERHDVRIIPGGGTRRIKKGEWEDVEPK